MFISSCINSLLTQSKPPGQIIVVDNGSSDGSLELLAESYPMVEVHALRANTGLTHAYNIGLARAKFEWVVLANNDIILDRFALEELANATSSPSVLVTPMFLSMTVPHRPQTYPAMFAPSVTHPWSSMKRKVTSSECLRTDISGLGLVLGHKNAFGRLDEAFPFYFNEDDFSLRCRRKNLKILLVPNSVVYHFGSGTIGRLSLHKIHLFMIGWVHYRIKWFPVWSLLPSTIFSLVLQAYQHLAVLLDKPELLLPSAETSENQGDS